MQLVGVFRADRSTQCSSDLRVVIPTAPWSRARAHSHGRLICPSIWAVNQDSVFISDEKLTRSGKHVRSLSCDLLSNCGWFSRWFYLQESEGRGQSWPPFSACHRFFQSPWCPCSYRHTYTCRSNMDHHKVDLLIPEFLIAFSHYPRVLLNSQKLFMVFFLVADEEEERREFFRHW